MLIHRSSRNSSLWRKQLTKTICFVWDEDDSSNVLHTAPYLVRNWPTVRQPRASFVLSPKIKKHPYKIKIIFPLAPKCIFYLLSTSTSVLIQLRAVHNNALVCGTHTRNCTSIYSITLAFNDLVRANVCQILFYFQLVSWVQKYLIQNTWVRHKIKKKNNT